MKLTRGNKQRVHVKELKQNFGKYTYWQVTWTHAGKPYNRTFSDEKEAERFAGSVLDAIEAGHPEIVFADKKAVDLFCMLYNRIGEDRLIEVLQSETQRVLHTISIRDAATEYLRALKENGRSQRHQYTVKSNLERFITCTQKPLHMVTKHDIDEYLSQFKAPKTRVNHRTTLCSMFAYAQRKGWLSTRKTAAELSERPSFKPTEPEIYSPEEMIKLLDKADELTMAHLVIGGFCGARSAEIQRLRWEHVRVDAIIFPTEITKTSMRRATALEKNAKAWLEALRRDPKDPVTWTETALNRKIRDIHEQAGVRRKSNGLRHSYVSYHMQVYANASLTSQHCGHSIAQLRRHYMQITDDQTAREWFKIMPASCCNLETEPVETPNQD